MPPTRPNASNTSPMRFRHLQHPPRHLERLPHVSSAYNASLTPRMRPRRLKRFPSAYNASPPRL
ncbi:hypothetical protein OG21DRAFT_1511852 [Imleria badia]|nr:hypothetical protein OG21DRAFT_1511852 [Imleria badia]